MKEDIKNEQGCEEEESNLEIEVVGVGRIEEVSETTLAIIISIVMLGKSSMCLPFLSGQPIRFILQKK